MTVEPFLFSADGALLRDLFAGSRPAQQRPAAVLVDWERHDKAIRQVGARQRIGTDTQISTDTEDDLAQVRAIVTGVPVICRVDGDPGSLSREIRRAVDLGADEVLVPMVRDVATVEAALRHAGDGTGVGIMIETVEAVAAAGTLGRLPIARAYVGLMDLALERGTPSIFTALVDGTVERVREAMRVPFGFAGMTVPGRGSPIPSDLLITELARLDAAFSFLRRSFISDIAGQDPGEGITAIRDACAAAARRPDHEIGRDRRQLVEAVARAERR